MGLSQDNSFAQETLSDVSALDTGKRSLLHALFSRAPSSVSPSFREYAVPYGASALVLFVAPCLVALSTGRMLAPARYNGTGLGFLGDPYTVFLTLVVMPSMVMLTVTERRRIPLSLARAFGSGALILHGTSARDLRVLWESRYRKANVFSQVGGLLLGAGLSLLNSLVLCRLRGFHWATHGGNLTGLGWYSALVIQPFFWWALCVHLSRAFVGGRLLCRLAESCTVRVNPFHHDGAGGLKSIGLLVLRNHYLLAVLALSMLGLWVNVKFLQPEPIPGRMERLIGLMVAYAVVAPFFFLFPLLPFRQKMLEYRRRQQNLLDDLSRRENEQMFERLAHGQIPDGICASASSLKQLKDLIGSTPVWPLNAMCLGKFLFSYAFPIAAFVVTPFLGQFAQHVVSAMFRGH